MHTDEFETSLSRELNVCKRAIKRIHEFMAIMERKHALSTAEFVKHLHEGTMSSALQEDSEAWKSNYDSLARWQEMQKQYEEMLHDLKISQPEHKQFVKISFKKGK